MAPRLGVEVVTRVHRVAVVMDLLLVADLRWVDPRWADLLVAPRWADLLVAPWADLLVAPWADLRWVDPRWADPRWADPRWADPRWADLWAGRCNRRRRGRLSL